MRKALVASAVLPARTGLEGGGRRAGGGGYREGRCQTGPLRRAPKACMGRRKLGFGSNSAWPTPLREPRSVRGPGDIGRPGHGPSTDLTGPRRLDALAIAFPASTALPRLVG